MVADDREQHRVRTVQELAVLHGLEAHLRQHVRRPAAVPAKPVAHFGVPIGWHDPRFYARRARSRTPLSASSARSGSFLHRVGKTLPASYAARACRARASAFDPLCSDRRQTRFGRAAGRATRAPDSLSNIRNPTPFALLSGWHVV